MTVCLDGRSVVIEPAHLAADLHRMDPIVLSLLPGTLIGVGVVLYLWSGVWVYRDAEKRGKPAWLVALLVLLLSWPLSLVLWVLLRPRPRFNLDDYRVQ